VNNRTSLQGLLQEATGATQSQLHPIRVLLLYNIFQRACPRFHAVSVINFSRQIILWIYKFPACKQ